MTELRGENNETLPDRFQIAMRAIRGEFSPSDGADTEDVDDAITAALLTFPAQVKLRVVSSKLSAEQAATLEADLSRMIDALVEAEFSMQERAGRLSFDVVLTVPSAAALAAVRGALKSDERVAMVF